MGRKKSRSSPGPYLFKLQLLRERVAAPAEYPFCLPAIRNLETLEFHEKVTFFVGDNGTGKSTLLEALALANRLNPEGGSRNFNFAIRASHSSLCDCLRVSRSAVSPNDSYFLRAESFYNVATEIERLDREGGSGPSLITFYGGKSLHEQSHGESFFALFMNRFRGNGLYLMDEPEAALSPKRQIEFLSLLHEFCKKGSQFVIATHSPIIMAYPDARIYLFGADGIRQVPYTETEHYLITRGFLSNPRQALATMFNEPTSEPPS